jgi:hypothetical protein
MAGKHSRRQRQEQRPLFDRADRADGCLAA